MSTPRTMLFTPTPPGCGSVGEIYLAELVRDFPNKNICCYAAWSRNYAVYKESPDLDWMPLKVRELPEELLVGRNRGPYKDQLHSFFRRPKQWAALQPIVDEAVEFGREQKVELIIAVLASPSTIKMTAEVASRLNCKLACIVLDPPESTLKLLGFDPFNFGSVIADFYECLTQSAVIAVASEGMRADLKQKVGKDSFVITRPIRERVAFREPARTDRFTIGFCGSMYASDTFACFFEALKQMQWQVDGKPLALKLMGNQLNLPINAGCPATVEFLGQRPISETIELMADCDLAYLPYWFDPRFALSVRTCLPDKLVSYIASGPPVLFHGPEDSSVTRFMEKYPVGIRCHTNDPEDVAKVLSEAAANRELRRTAYDAGSRAIADELSPETFARNVNTLATALDTAATSNAV